MAEDGLVKPTNAEKLYRKIAEGNRDASKECSLIKSIMSVYYFLRHRVGMIDREMSVEEFELGEIELRAFCIEQSKRWHNRVLQSIGFLRPAAFYLENGFFHIREAPIDEWYKNHPFHESNYILFDLEEHLSWLEESRDHYPMSIPPNLKDLYKALSKKRFRKEKN